MNKHRIKTKKPHISIAGQLNAMVELSPSSAPDIIHDFPHQDPIAASGPPHNEIAVRAREIYIEEAHPQGQSDEIWRRAELEKRDINVTARRGKTRG